MTALRAFLGATEERRHWQAMVNALGVGV